MIWNVCLQTLKKLSDSIDKLKTELGSHTNPFAPTSPTVKSPEQAKREILDMELELITKETSGQDTADLKHKLDELTKIVSTRNSLYYDWYKLKRLSHHVAMPYLVCLVLVWKRYNAI